MNKRITQPRRRRSRRRLVAAHARVMGCWLVLLTIVAGFGPMTASAATNGHWAYQPLRRPSVPSGSPLGPVDAFVTGVLSAKKQTLAPPASGATLIRRLSFDLRGLPPSPEEVAEFLQDERPEAFSQLVDRFLASPRHGERWGRHWLDLVGYADSNGYFSADSDRPLAWRFRDYVIRSINGGKPLDRFIQEQLAGDELVGYVADGDVTPDMIDPLIATHFWRNAPDGTGESDGNPLEVKIDKYAVIEGGVQIVGSSFLGITMHCARCHDHKFEPITQQEYYGLQAVIRPAFDPGQWLKPNERVIELGLRTEREAHKRELAAVQRDLKTIKDSLEGLAAPFRKQLVEENLAPLDPSLRKAIQRAIDTKEKDRGELMKSLLKTNAALVDVTVEALEKRFPAFSVSADSLRKALKKRETETPAPLERIAATFETTNVPPAHHLFVRGDHAKEGPEVGPMIPVALAPPASGSAGNRPAASSADAFNALASRAHSPGSSGRRLALARWLTSSNNPVVARVLANRIWHYHFGQGLVSTVDNLGQSGAPPISPELLDFLAMELIESGWNMKHLHRLILNSGTWKQAHESGHADTALGRGELRRLDAESLRDAMLAVSGELDLTMHGPYVPTRTDKHGQVIIAEKEPGARRRSIYLQQRRTHPVEFLSTFDGPAHNPVCVQRVNSTVALQSLSLLNSEFVRLRAQAFAQRILAEAGDLAVDKRLAVAFRKAYGRPGTDEESAGAQEFLREQVAIYSGQAEAELRVWTDLAQMLLASSAFLYVD